MQARLHVHWPFHLLFNHIRETRGHAINGPNITKWPPIMPRYMALHQFFFFEYLYREMTLTSRKAHSLQQLYYKQKILITNKLVLSRRIIDYTILKLQQCHIPDVANLLFTTSTWLSYFENVLKIRCKDVS